MRKTGPSAHVTRGDPCCCSRSFIWESEHQYQDISEYFNIQFLLFFFFSWCRRHTLTLSHTLALVTPVLPFIANPVWQHMCPVSPCRQIQHRHGSSIFSHPSNGRFVTNVCCYLPIFTLINTPHIPHSAAFNEAIYSLWRERERERCRSQSQCVFNAWTDLHLSASSSSSSSSLLQSLTSA